ncbi:MAG: sulfatase [Phycisphaerae bacterium]
MDHKRVTRRRFLASTGAAGAAALAMGAGAGALAAQKSKRPNVLWIISEDTGPEFGCYGYPQVHTPNVDRLAREGARYTNAFTTNPVCSPSRSAFMTGMYQTTIGAHQHRTPGVAKEPLPEGVHVFTKYFRDAGYFTALCGKGKTDWNFNTTVKPYDSNTWEGLKTHQPFFCQYQFSETHRGFKHCKAHPVDPEKVSLPPYYPDHPVARKDWAMYLETVNVLDEKIGKVLDRLEADGLAENTIVFYFGDHGRAHVRGKQWLYDGGIHVPLVVRAPGVTEAGTVVDEMVSAIDFGPTCLRLCGIAPPAHMQGRVFLGPDRDEPRECIFAARDRCDETVERIRCLRDKRWKYIRNFMPGRPWTQPNYYKLSSYPMLGLMHRLHDDGKLTPEQDRWFAPRKPVEELYDLENDPWEVHNLARDKAHADRLAAMRQQVFDWIERTGDRGMQPEDPEALRQFLEARRKRGRLDYSKFEFLH